MTAAPAVRIGLLLFPKVTQLDLTGPFEVLSRVPGAQVDLVWKTADPVVSDHGLTLVPTATFSSVGPLDVLLVPGGHGVGDLMLDDDVLGFLTEQAASVSWLCSVCTGALVLGAAGLLAGHRATTHWAYLDLLPLFGATPSSDRVVVDRDRITGGGITAGIDAALVVAASLTDARMAAAISLHLEYDPSPPFGAGHPRTSPPDVVAEVGALLAPLQERRRAIALDAARRLRTTRLERVIDAPPAAVYAALLSPDAVQRWMVPDDMSSVVHSFDAREGGRFRISLTYDSGGGVGKTAAHTDTHHGRFVRLVPDTVVVQAVTFESDDPSMQGEMTISYDLSPSDAGGTRLVATHEDLPLGLDPSENELGWSMSLDKLARLVSSPGGAER